MLGASTRTRRRLAISTRHVCEPSSLRRWALSGLPVRNGIADVAGVPRPVLRAFSRRRAEIEAELTRLGTSSAGGCAGGGVGDPAGEGPVGRSAATAAGVARARGGAGVRRARACAQVFGRIEPPVVTREALRSAADRLASPQGLTERVSSFSRRDVIRAWCEELPPGAQLDSERVERLADAFLGSERAVALLGSAGRRGLTRCAAATVVVRRCFARRSATRRRSCSRSSRRSSMRPYRAVGTAVGVADRDMVAAALARRPFLSRRAGA